MKIKLQPRDLELLHALSKYGVMSSRQISQWIFKNVALTTVLRRLRLLNDSHIIINCGHLPNGNKAWSLSNLGADAIHAPPPFRFANHNTFYHDTLVVDLRMTLESIGLGDNWTTEQEMKRTLSYYDKDSRVIPDGVFVASAFGGEMVISLELELHTKAYQRYRNLFYDYCHMDAISLIWYVVKDETIIRPVLKIWHEVMKHERVKPPQKIIFTLSDDLLANRHEAQIYDDNMKSNSLYSCFALNKTCQGLSTETASALSRCEAKDQKSNQALNPAPELKINVPCALDHSPTTSKEWGSGRETTGT